MKQTPLFRSDYNSLNFEHMMNQINEEEINGMDDALRSLTEYRGFERRQTPEMVRAAARGDLDSYFKAAGMEGPDTRDPFKRKFMELTLPQIARDHANKAQAPRAKSAKSPLAKRTMSTKPGKARYKGPSKRGFGYLSLSKALKRLAGGPKSTKARLERAVGTKLYSWLMDAVSKAKPVRIGKRGKPLKKRGPITAKSAAQIGGKFFGKMSKAYPFSDKSGRSPKNRDERVMNKAHFIRGLSLAYQLLASNVGRADKAAAKIWLGDKKKKLRLFEWQLMRDLEYLGEDIYATFMALVEGCERELEECIDRLDVLEEGSELEADYEDLCDTIDMLSEGKQSQEARELELYINNNDDAPYRQKRAIFKNLAKKKKKGRYDRKLAVKGMMHAVDNGARAYTKEHGSPGSRPKDIFPRSARTEVANAFVDEFEDEHDIGNVDESVWIDEDDREYYGEDAPEYIDEAVNFKAAAKVLLKKATDAKRPIGYTGYLRAVIQGNGGQATHMRTSKTYKDDAGQAMQDLIDMAGKANYEESLDEASDSDKYRKKLLAAAWRATNKNYRSGTLRNNPKIMVMSSAGTRAKNLNDLSNDELRKKARQSDLDKIGPAPVSEAWLDEAEFTKGPEASLKAAELRRKKAEWDDLPSVAYDPAYFDEAVLDEETLAIFDIVESMEESDLDQFLEAIDDIEYEYGHDEDLYEEVLEEFFSKLKALASKAKSMWKGAKESGAKHDKGERAKEHKQAKAHHKRQERERKHARNKEAGSAAGGTKMSKSGKKKLHQKLKDCKGSIRKVFGHPYCHDKSSKSNKARKKAREQDKRKKAMEKVKAIRRRRGKAGRRRGKAGADGRSIRPAAAYNPAYFDEGVMQEDLRLNQSDKKVIRAFLNGQALSSNKLSTNGRSLDISGMGGKGAATRRDNGMIALHDLGSRSGETVHRAVKKLAPGGMVEGKDLVGMLRSHLPSEAKVKGQYEKGVYSYEEAAKYLKMHGYSSVKIKKALAESTKSDWRLEQFKLRKELSNGAIISTVNAFGTYETLVFAKGERRLEIDGSRYNGKSSAVKGHHKFVAKWKRKSAADVAKAFSSRNRNESAEGDLSMGYLLGEGLTTENIDAVDKAIGAYGLLNETTLTLPAEYSDGRSARSLAEGHDYHKLGAELQHWNKGEGSPVHKVGSMLFAGRKPWRKDVCDAVEELQAMMMSPSYGEHEQELRSIISRLRSVCLG